MIGDGFIANSCAGACNCVGGIPTQATLGAEKSQLWGVRVDLDDAYHSVKVNLHSRLLQVFTNRNLSLHFDRFLTTPWFDYVGQERVRGTTLLWWRTLYVRCRAVWTESSMQFRGCISLLQPWRPAVQAHLSCSLGITHFLEYSMNTRHRTWTCNILQYRAILQLSTDMNWWHATQNHFLFCRFRQTCWVWAHNSNMFISRTAKKWASQTKYKHLGCKMDLIFPFCLFANLSLQMPPNLLIIRRHTSDSWKVRSIAGFL